MTEQLRESEVVDRDSSGLLPTGNVGPDTIATRSLGRDAWLTLRSNWIFWVSSVLIVCFTFMAIAPGLITHTDPTFCEAIRARGGPSSKAWFGYDVQGCDVFARTIFGARASMLVGGLATLFAMVVGAGIGIYAGFYGGLIDTLLSRLTDVFIGIPLIIGTIIVLSSFPGTSDSSLYDILKVAVAIAVFGWTQTARVARASVIQVRHADYVQASRCLGASRWWMIRKHVIPNAAAPVIVVTTLSLGGYIGAEAALSFLGIGLQPPTVSWGIAINDAQSYVRTTPHMLFFPALFLSLAVLGFIMLGDAVQEALDPKRL
jgi:oligopeptide transport system permease protein